MENNLPQKYFIGRGINCGGMDVYEEWVRSFPEHDDYLDLCKNYPTKFMEEYSNLCQKVSRCRGSVNPQEKNKMYLKQESLEEIVKHYEDFVINDFVRRVNDGVDINILCRIYQEFSYKVIAPLHINSIRNEATERITQMKLNKEKKDQAEKTITKVVKVQNEKEIKVLKEIKSLVEEPLPDAVLLEQIRHILKTPHDHGRG